MNKILIILGLLLLTGCSGTMQKSLDIKENAGPPRVQPAPLADRMIAVPELDGKKMDAELLKGKRFAFLQKESAVLMGSSRKFSQHGRSGMWFSDLVPNLAKYSDDICMIRSMHTDQFNHHPGQLQMQCGEAKFGIPSTGSWINYGLGSENQDG